MKIDAAALTPLMSHAFAQRHGILAVALDEQGLTVASAQPFVRGWEADLVQVLRRPIRRVVANPAEIRRFIAEFHRLARSVSGASGGGAKTPGSGNFEQLLDLGAQDGSADANDAHVVTIVDWLFHYAFQQRASDIHIEPRREQTKVRFRIDGVLHNVYQFPPPVGMAVISRLKSLGRMNVAEKRKPQDGRVKTRTPEGSEIELRLSTLPTAFGEKLVMRIFDPEVLLQSFERLGFAADDLRRWQAMTGERMAPVFRAPGGRTSGALLAAAQRCGWAHVGWAPAGFLGDELDSDRFPNERLLARALRDIRPGDVLMAHLGIWSRQDPWAPAVLEPLITGLKARGHCFATLRHHPAHAARLREEFPSW